MSATSCIVAFLATLIATCLFSRIHGSSKDVSVPMNPVSKPTAAWKLALDFSEMLATTTAPAKTLSVMTLPSMTLPSTFFPSFFWFPSVFWHSDAFQKMTWFKVLALLDPSKQFVMICLSAVQALNFLVLQLNILWKVAAPRVVWIKQGAFAIVESVLSNARHWLLGNVSKNTMGMIFDQLDNCGDPGVLAKHNDAPVPCGDDPQNDYSDVSGDLRDDLLSAPTGQASGNDDDHKGTAARCDARAPTTASLGDAPFSFFAADMSRVAPLSGDAKNISTTGSDQLSQGGAHGAGKSVNATKKPVPLSKAGALWRKISKSSKASCATTRQKTRPHWFTFLGHVGKSLAPKTTSEVANGAFDATAALSKILLFAAAMNIVSQRDAQGQAESSTCATR